MEYVVCNLCGFDDTRLWAQKDGLEIVQCCRCSLIYTNPRLDEIELREYYNQAYFDDRTPEADPTRYEMYRIEIEDMVQTIPARGRFLDVGCANGIFLSVLPDTFEKYGIDYSSTAVEQGKIRYGYDLRAGTLGSIDDKFSDEFFDVIHIRAVIEHMRDPYGDLKKASDALADGGWIVVGTAPNIESPCGLLFRERFRLVFPKEHIYYFSPRTLSLMLNKVGFEPKRWIFPYPETPYANLEKDARDFVQNYKGGEESPPFWGSVMTTFAKKTRPSA